MNHSSKFVAAAFTLSTFALVACDDPEQDRQKSMVAQGVANDKITAANSEVANKAAAAQSEATDKAVNAQKDADQKIAAAKLDGDKKIADAQAELKKLREDSQKANADNLAELDRKLTAMALKAKKANGKAKAELDDRLKRFTTARAEFTAHFQALDNATAQSWEETKKRLDKEWQDLNKMTDPN
jgi:hypothetical protein